MAKEESMYDELVRVTKRKPKAKEPVADFTMEILKKCQKLSDDDWNSLREETQEWVNEQVALDNDGKEFALLEPDTEVGAAAAAASKRGVDAAETESDPSDDTQEDAMAKSATVRKTTEKGGKGAAKASAKGSARRPIEDANGAGRGRRGSFALDAKITLLSKDNPKREGSAAHGRFAKYKTGMSVQAALSAGLGWDDLRYDSERKFIAIK